MSSDLEDVIESAASDPKTATQDGNSLTSRSIDELIKADKYLAGKRAVANGKSAWGATRPTRVVLPDSIGPRCNTDG